MQNREIKPSHGNQRPQDKAAAHQANSATLIMSWETYYLFIKCVVESFIKTLFWSIFFCSLFSLSSFKAFFFWKQVICRIKRLLTYIPSAVLHLIVCHVKQNSGVKQSAPRQAANTPASQRPELLTWTHYDNLFERPKKDFQWLNLSAAAYQSKAFHTTEAIYSKALTNLS